MLTWFLTGCSTGLGRSLAEYVLARGDRAVVTARRIDSVSDFADRYPDTALVLPLDVTVAAQITEAVAAALGHFDAVDVLVNNAGYGYRSALEEGDDDAVQTLFATNVFGPVALMKALLPGMRARGRGTIVNVSSIGAKIKPAGSGYYAATKAALEGLTGALRKEIAPLGLTAMSVEPGGFRTDFAGRSLAQSSAAISAYAETAGKRRKENDRVHGTQPGDPNRAAAAIVEAVESGNPPEILHLGSDALGAARQILQQELADLHAWERLTVSTDFPG